MHAHDCLEHRADGVDVSLLAALLSTSCVQDVAAVQDQEQHVHLRRLQALLTRAVLNQHRTELSSSKQAVGLEISDCLFSNSGHGGALQSCLIVHFSNMFKPPD